MFKVKSLRLLSSEAEVGLSAHLSVSSIIWKFAKKEGADGFASQGHCGATLVEQMDCLCSSLQ